jgi:hypothetical protein
MEELSQLLRLRKLCGGGGGSWSGGPQFIDPLAAQRSAHPQLRKKPQEEEAEFREEARGDERRRPESSKEARAGGRGK